IKTSKISSAAPNAQYSYTQALEKHILLSYAMIVINQDDKIIHHNYYVGTDAVEHFLNTAKDLSFRLIDELKKLFGNINDYIWLESQMRGGICLVSKRYARANNPSLSSIYDPSKPHSYILALNIVNLYGYAMSQFLPTARFQQSGADNCEQEKDIEKLESLDPVQSEDRIKFGNLTEGLSLNDKGLQIFQNMDSNEECTLLPTVNTTP
ncbi:uncharacterized protein TNCV_4605071, partial [Trichonephila clavipes]